MYNLFRQRSDPSIVCALRDGAAMPAFLTDEAWRYDGKVPTVETRLREYDRAAAESISSLNGYYIFTTH